MPRTHTSSGTMAQIYNVSTLVERELEMGESLGASESFSLEHTAAKSTRDPQKRWEVRTDTQGCPLTHAWYSSTWIRLLRSPLRFTGTCLHPPPPPQALPTGLLIPGIRPGESITGLHSLLWLQRITSLCRLCFRVGLEFCHTVSLVGRGNPGASQFCAMKDVTREVSLCCGQHFTQGLTAGQVRINRDNYVVTTPHKIQASLRKLGKMTIRAGSLEERDQTVPSGYDWTCARMDTQQLQLSAQDLFKIKAVSIPAWGRDHGAPSSG